MNTTTHPITRAALSLQYPSWCEDLVEHLLTLKPQTLIMVYERDYGREVSYDWYVCDEGTECDAGVCTVYEWLTR